MVRKFGIAVAVAAGLCFAGTQAMAQDSADFTKDELKCESGTAKALGKQVSGQSKCVDKCVKAQRKVIPAGDYSNCLALVPNLPCITDPLKGTTAKTSASIGKACVKDCPACYGGTQCTDGQPLVGTTLGLVATQGPLVYCVEYAGGLNNGVPTKTEAKCEDDTAKNLVKFVASINKCYDKCVKDVQANKLPFNACAPALGAGAPPPINATLNECLLKGQVKAAAGIDKSCGPLKPACYGAFDGNGWTGLVQGLVQGQVDDISCGSPSGAFLN